MRAQAKNGDAQSLARDVITAMNEITRMERIWRRGLNHPGGPHYRIKGMFSPISIGRDEMVIFGRVIEHFRPSNCFIIGNAFGTSSVFIAKMMERCSGRSVVTLDDKSEGNGELCFTTAADLRRRMKADILTNKAGTSPRDVESAAEDESYDLIFIDGEHTHPQVTKDYVAIKPLVHEKSIICWHDYWMPGIPESVVVAEIEGFRCLKLESSCEMVLGTRDPGVHSEIERIFPGAKKPDKIRCGAHPPPLVFLSLSLCFLTFLWSKYVLRYPKSSNETHGSRKLKSS